VRRAVSSCSVLSEPSFKYRNLCFANLGVDAGVFEFCLSYADIAVGQIDRSADFVQACFKGPLVELSKGLVPFHLVVEINELATCPPGSCEAAG
jgi:hypothetical protein